jgi:hypothetical protein
MSKIFTQTLSISLKEHVNISDTRRETLVWLITLIIRQGTVSLWRLAAHVDSPAKKDSVYHRLRRFFRHVRFDETLIARLVVHLSGLTDKPWELALDRTNWKFGKCHINILMLGIVHNGVCIPLLWSMLPRAGNSNAAERIDLMGRMRRIFPDQEILRITGDREFIGNEWIGWLQAHKIPFVLRLKENMHIWNDDHVPAPLSWVAQDIKKGKRLILKGQWRIGRDRDQSAPAARIVIMRLKTGELLILFTSGRPAASLAQYRKRWQIETLFSCLKARGLGLEDTHMTHPGRLSTLIAVLAIAFVLTVKTGLWAARCKPPQAKSHGFPARALFAMGLDVLRKFFAVARPAQVKNMCRDLWTQKIPRKPLPVNVF